MSSSRSSSTELAKIGSPESELDLSEDDPQYMTRGQAWCLYILHFLFAWNARTYEFAAIVFTAAAYPDTLTATSIRGISTTVASICFASAVGSWIDHAPSRLWILRVTISAQRISIVIAYVFWLFLANDDKAAVRRRNTIYDHVETRGDTLLQRSFDWTPSGHMKNILFAIILILGVVEHLSDIANRISLDRDWLPILAPSSASSLSASTPYDLTHLNAVMRRIDLICKVITPFLISGFVTTVNHHQIGIIAVALVSGLSWAAELWCARKVYSSSSALCSPKEFAKFDTVSIIERVSGNEAISIRNPLNLLYEIWHQSVVWFWDQSLLLQQYFSTSVWIPSMAWALLHLTVLAYSASLITYLLNIGVSLYLITIASATGSLIEVSSTVLTPWVIHRLSRERAPDAPTDDEAVEFFSGGDKEARGNGGNVLEKVGLYGITWQFFCLIPVVLALWQITPNTSIPSSSSDASNAPIPILSAQPFAVIALVFFLSSSRLGIWTYDLTTQEITQTRVLEDRRSAFAGTEQSFQSFFQLCHWVATAVYGTPSNFRYLALGSLGAVGCSAGIYAAWVWKLRR